MSGRLVVGIETQAPYLSCSDCPQAGECVVRQDVINARFFSRALFFRVVSRHRDRRLNDIRIRLKLHLHNVMGSLNITGNFVFKQCTVFLKLKTPMSSIMAPAMATPREPRRSLSCASRSSHPSGDASAVTVPTNISTPAGGLFPQFTR